MARERTLVLLKPDVIRRRLIGELIGRLERKRLDIIAMKMIRVDQSLAETHYAEHREKPFYRELIGFITSGPVVAMVVEGPQAVAVVRNLMGPTDPFEAPPGSIRGDLGLDLTANLIHGSDSLQSAREEVDLFFEQRELLEPASFSSESA